ncbi:PREDICTED: centrosome-associated protein 350 isoform X1 [Poecilia mexicana]|uniref:CAP-Gly domain-containing protein n=1 Tax=Poecilia mexicana TaxID=48701 RepID=A0A3B3YUS2_9TELE|nr:PREDICTED: centrosome-associated protein 350 isoform X1 [Poecilia mexicana]
MRSSRRTEVPHTRSAQLLTDHNIGTELTTAWKTLAQSKAALRHIENRLEATPGTAALLDSIPISPKKKTSSSSHSRDGQQGDESRGTSKPRGGNQQSPAKSSSRSPLRNATQDSNVRKNSNVEFREPLASYREATPPSHPFSQLEAYNLQSVPGSSYTSSLPSSDPLPSQLIYQRDTRDKQTDGDLDSTRSSALESAEVRYLNDQPVLDGLKTEQNTHKAQLVMDSHESKSFARTSSSSRQGESTPSSSPGSVSQRLENLRRHQPDDKLEKLKERIRRQRQHLEEMADKEKSKSCLEKPIVAFVEGDNVGSSSMPAAKIRKVTAAPPAPIYKGFNSAETKVQIPDGKVWKEDEFHNFNRKVYRDISYQFPESSKFRHQHQRTERSKEKRPSKPVRKVQKVPPVEQNFKPVISPASWREGQKLVKMVLGPAPKLTSEEHSSHPGGRLTRTASHHHSDPHSEQRRHTRSSSTERSRSAFQEQTASRPTASYSPSSSAQDKTLRGVKTDVLSVDIQGILNDLQLDCKSAEMEERARKRSRGVSGSRRGRGGSGSRTRAPVSAWGSTGVANTSSRVCRSASPTTRQPDNSGRTSKSVKKRHYDADTVRQYIVQQQEERKRRQAEERRAVKEEAAKRNQRLQELYKKQREVARTATLSSEAVVAPVQKRLQETYTRLLLEDARLSEGTPEPHSAPFIQMRPMYQPSGESDKENKRIGVSQSPSSSDKSLNEQPPLPLSRNDLEFTSLLQPDHPAFQPSSGVQVASNEHLLSQLLRLEAALASSSRKYTEQPVTAPHLQSPTRMSRIEALKAKATSLSNRIETEARRFAGQGINYGAATSMDVDTVLHPRTSSLDVDHWTGAVAHATENNDFSFRAQKAFTNAANTSYTGIVLPGAGNLHDLNGKTHTGLTNPHAGSPGVNGLTLNTYTQEDRRIIGNLGMEERTEKLVQRIKTKKPENLVYPYQTDLYDSSAGSISEGPLLSEGSFSEEYGSPPHYTSNHGCNSDYLEAADCSAGKRSHNKRLLEFQREAAEYAALSPPFTQLNGSKAPWEELNEGSPLSVINIFTKNVQGPIKVSERASGNNSPLPHSSHSENNQDEAAVYEDDFVSSHSSKTSSHLKRGPRSPSRSQRISPGSTPGSSPLSRHSTSKRATISDQSDATLVEEQRSSPLSETLSSDHKKRASDRSLSQAQAKSADSDTLGEPSAYSPQRPKLVSSSCSPDLSSSLTADSLSEHVRRSSHNPKTSSRAESWSTGELQYSPAVLQQRMAAELQYLETIEESIKQLGDVEKLMGVSMAQQESTSLTQMLKAKQHRHEQELYELKIKTEREALETKLQLEENRQRVARAHLELQENLATSQKQTLEGLQESTSKMMSQQAEAARYTADAARHIKEMTDLARSQIAGHLIIPPVATDSAMLVQQEELNSPYTKQQDKADSSRFKSEISDHRIRSGEPSASQNSLSQSDSPSFRRPNISGSPYGSSQTSPSHAPSDQTERPNTQSGERKQKTERVEERMKAEAASSSVEEDVITAANDSLYSESIASAGDEKGDTTSVATEYSLKFDESMTEDEIEERSFRSLLPSEAHRRGTMEKKSHHQKEEGAVCLNETLVPETGSCSSFKSHDAHIAFSGGQDSFSQFTMEMVRQYMRDEEVRLQHQSSLLHLRQKALKEKTRTEVAWLEHQKKKLRDKGEDDKMPPIRKKQRGLLLKLQQEQAEIRRLQEANRAARKERQLLLKQQEEIERMRNSTLRLKERLKYAEGDAPPEMPVSEPSGSERLPGENRTPSPSLSISGSETSSIMQKLKKMRSHMDEKHCSPVHYFFSVFTAHHWASLSVCLPNLHPKFQLFIYNQLVRFLTKREQQLMQRRHHAEELLQWKQQLDKEEAEVRRMEKEALAAWDQRRPLDKDHKTPDNVGKEISETGSQASHHQSLEARSDSEKELVSEDNYSSITTESSVHTEALASQHPLSPSSAHPASVVETPLASIQGSHATYTQDFSTESQLPAAKSSLVEGSRSPAASPLDSSSKTKMQHRSTSRTHSEVFPEVLGAATAMPSENISDQSDIESRIKALREELKKRKIMAHQLKKEQKKRQKERLKAQEATLLKKLENYNNFIEKTKAELNKEPDSTPETTSHINDSSYILEQSSVKPSSHRSDAIKSATSDRTLIDASIDHNAIPQPNDSRTASRDLPKDSPSVVMYSRPESDHLSEPLSRSFFKPESEEEKALSDHRSDIEEELDVEVNSRSEDEQSHHLLRLDSQEKLTASERVLPFTKEEHEQSLSGSLHQEEPKKRNKIPEAEEAVTSNNITPGAPFSAVVNLEASPRSSRSPSPTEHPLSPHSVGFSLNKDPLIKDVETSAGTDGYQEDFESANSSPRDKHISKHESQTSIPHTEPKHSTKESPRTTPPFDHQDDEEEEIPEEMSQHSGINEQSHHSEKLLELQPKEEDIKLDNKTEFSSQAPASPPPVEDEMPGFHLGDRVLVGGVQPGTLRFKGPTSFANGFWAGVELDKSEGSNNGTYDGVVYFECEESHGIFAPPDKVSHLPDKFELYADTTEDEDSFCDDLSDKGQKKHKKVKDGSQKREDPEMQNEQTSEKETKSKDEMVLDENDQIPLKNKAHLNSQHQKEPEHQICNGNMKDIILDFTDESRTFLIPDEDRMEEKNEKTTAIIERNDVDIEKDLIPTDEIKADEREQKSRDLVETFAEELINNFIKDSFKQCAEIKRAKEEKIRNANQSDGCSFVENNDEKWISSVEQKDNLPFFLPAEKEELSSPELCNRSESPVFGPSGQEKLAKRLAELELSRELLEDLGDDQDWFDEDFGLSSRRQQQRLKQKEELGGELGRSASSSGHMGGMVSSLGGESQVKTPPRPELPLPLPPKLPEQPAMVVPHSATEVEKMVHSATQEIWETFDLGRKGSLILEHLPKPTPSPEYLGKESSSQDQEVLSISSYKKAVYDLTWEILKEIFAEDPNTDQPQWVKPRQVKSSSIHRVKTSGDISKIQEFVTEEVLKLYGLTQDENQKTDWQKMLKFGRKKRDRVDHILVQELHEEEAQWVNYDEDELFVKIQLADSIFEALLKDTVNTFTLISDKRAKRGALS